MFTRYKSKRVGIDLPELIRLKQEPLIFQWLKTNNVGIDLPELIRLKHEHGFAVPLNDENKSGLICLNWYDWNLMIDEVWQYFSSSRDWSAWIDTIETLHEVLHHEGLVHVGIDLPELIRLKQGSQLPPLLCLTCRDWSAWIDTIETLTTVSLVRLSVRSGLICLNWYDWNFSY